MPAIWGGSLYPENPNMSLIKFNLLKISNNNTKTQLYYYKHSAYYT